MLDELKDIIEKEYRHPYYDECIQVADDAWTIHGDEGEDQRGQLERYRGAEGHVLMNQRTKLHNPITAAILQPTYSYLSYVYRADGIKRVHELKDEKKKDLIEANFERFYGEISLHEYVFKAVEHYNKYDPNAWVGFDRENVIDDSGAVKAVRIYPMEFTCPEVIDFRMNTSGRTTELTALKHFTGIDASGKTLDGLEKYLHYYPGGIVIAYEQKGEFTAPDIDDNFELMTFMRGKTPVQFWVKVVENGTKEVPFFRAGAFDHPKHRRRVKGLFVHNSKGLLFDIIRDSNLLAVMKVVHCWAEKAEYVKPCKHVNDQGEACYGGYYGGYRDADHLCHACRGTGKVLPLNEQEVKQLALPENAEDILDLSKLTHYVERPIEIVKFYVSELDRQSNLVFSTTYNQNNLRPTGAPRTATEITVNADLINNKLAPVASRVEDGWELAHRIAHQYYEVEGDVEMTHPSDFKVLTIDELIEQHRAAIDSNLPAAARQSIVDDILNKQYRNFPDIKYDIKAFESWKPWKDKSPEEVALIVSLRAEDDFYRQLWENWEAVTDTVRYNLDPAGRPRFYLLSRDLQLRELQQAIQQVNELVSYQVGPEPVMVDPFVEPVIE